MESRSGRDLLCASVRHLTDVDEPGGYRAGRSAESGSRTVRQAVVPAGGFGRRMWPLTRSRPKPMVEVHGTPERCRIRTNRGSPRTATSGHTSRRPTWTPTTGGTPRWPPSPSPAPGCPGAASTATSTAGCRPARPGRQRA
ncbi:sugar phosphate nucleotidyltransferase [Streptomyces sp. NPDC048644]|uniref:sugar phosphate nucleotidyltransferase n=1 Tax=Streptomyces sp. NPDC048644 TaxID=3365582 RepID=UPI00371420E8